jgi:hypothetical protein
MSPAQQLLLCLSRREFLAVSRLIEESSAAISLDLPDFGVPTLLNHVKSLLAPSKRKLNVSLAPALLRDAAMVLSAIVSSPAEVICRLELELCRTGLTTSAAPPPPNFAFNHAPELDVYGAHSLLDEVSAIGWTEGIKIMQSLPVSMPELLSAVITAAAHDKPQSIEMLLSENFGLNAAGSIMGPRARGAVEAILCMSSPGGQFISRIIAFFHFKEIGDVLLKLQHRNWPDVNKNNNYDLDCISANVLSWFEACPASIAPLSAFFKSSAIAGIDASPSAINVPGAIAAPSFWPALLRALVRSPLPVKRSRALTAAMADPCASWWLSQPLIFSDYYDVGPHSLSALGIISQGAFFPKVKKFSSLRRHVELAKVLSQAGARFCIPGNTESSPLAETELTQWASQDFAPTRAFLHRHKGWAIPEEVTGRSALFFSAYPKTFKALVKAGLNPLQTDIHGSRPEVHLLSNSACHQLESFAGFAKICAAQIKAGALSPFAVSKSTDPKRAPTSSVAELAPHSVELMNAWLKSAKIPPNAMQVETAILSSHFSMVGKWLKSAVFDHDQTLQSALWSALLKSFLDYQTPNPGKAESLLSMINAIASRPSSPWSSVRDTWMTLWSGKRHFGTKRMSHQTRLPEFCELSDPSPYLAELVNGFIGALSVWSLSPSSLAEDSDEEAILINIAIKHPHLLGPVIPKSLHEDYLQRFYWSLLEQSSRGLNAWKAVYSLIESGKLDLSAPPSVTGVELRAIASSVRAARKSLVSSSSSAEQVLFKVEEAVLASAVAPAPEVVRQRL